MHDAFALQAWFISFQYASSDIRSSRKPKARGKQVPTSPDCLVNDAESIEHKFVLRTSCVIDIRVCFPKPVRDGLGGVQSGRTTENQLEFL